jgi:5-methylcytosine-specific restriction endonuclease McrA
VSSTHTCVKCGDAKPQDGFYLKKRTGKYDSTCKSCRNIAAAERYQAQREARLLKSKEYATANADKIKAYKQGYAVENKGAIREKNRKRLELNGDAIREKDRERYKERREAMTQNTARLSKLPVEGDLALTYSSLLTVDDCPRVTESGLLAVCCSYCKEEFIPLRWQVRNRIAAIQGQTRGESHLYCSEGCKSRCPVYRKSPSRAGDLTEYNPFSTKSASRPDQAQLRQMVLDLYGHVCARCGETEGLIAHHIDPVIRNPIESLDLDNCVILCEGCHDEAHRLPGCSRIALTCKQQKLQKT